MPNHKSLKWSQIACAADIALDNFLAFMIAAPRCCTVYVYKNRLFHAIFKLVKVKLLFKLWIETMNLSLTFLKWFYNISMIYIVDQYDTYSLLLLIINLLNYLFDIQYICNNLPMLHVGFQKPNDTNK